MFLIIFNVGGETDLAQLAGPEWVHFLLWSHFIAPCRIVLYNDSIV